MKVDGYILTGLRKLRNRSHSPIILAHSFGSAHDTDAAAESLLTFEHFNNFPATRAALRRIARNAALGSQGKALVIDDFSVWPRPKGRGGSIICTEQDYVLAKTIEIVTGRTLRIARQAIYSIRSAARAKSRVLELNS